MSSSQYDYFRYLRRQAEGSRHSLGSERICSDPSDPASLQAASLGLLMPLLRQDCERRLPSEAAVRSLLKE